jgi:hypothetical protein
VSPDSELLAENSTMSDTYLRLIPNDPYYIPPKQAHSVAQEKLSQLIPKATEVTVAVYDTAQFVDQGRYFESVSCPYCGKDLNGWWQKAMDIAYKTQFDNLAVTLPCCYKQTSLNELNYQMQAGFARFVLSVLGPQLDSDLTESELEPIERLLNCKIRQIWARY